MVLMQLNTHAITGLRDCRPKKTSQLYSDMGATMANKKTTALVATRKKNPPRTAFKKDNPHRFKPGASGNPSGKSANDLKLVTRSLREQLNVRAPDAVAKGVGAGRGASWAQCIACALLRGAVAGDTQASRLLIEMTEGKAPTALTIGGMDGEPLFGALNADRPTLHVHFAESDGDGRLPADYIEGGIIDG